MTRAEATAAARLVLGDKAFTMEHHAAVTGAARFNICWRDGQWNGKPSCSWHKVCGGASWDEAVRVLRAMPPHVLGRHVAPPQPERTT